MSRTTFTLFLLFLYNLLPAQGNKTADTISARFADVDVLVTDMKGKPSKGEQVFFKSESTRALFGGRSDAGGKFSLRLPVGHHYIITVKSLTDTSKYGVIDIPAPAPDEFYTEPFRVNVKFELARSYTLDNVHFDFGKASLRADSYKELEELVSYLRYKDDVRIEIAGHTDNIGSDADNLDLSRRRAETIRNYLISKGITTSRVIAKGYGASQPVADNATEEGRQRNRRTEVRVL